MGRAPHLLFIATPCALVAALAIGGLTHGARKGGQTGSPEAPVNAARDAALAASAREALQAGDGARAFALLQRALAPGGKGAHLDPVATAQARPLAAALLARAALLSKQPALAAELFSALHTRYSADGAAAVAAYLALRAGDALCLAGRDADAIPWYRKAASAELALRATLGEARAMRRAGQAAAALALLEGAAPLALPADHPLRSELLAEAARCAQAAGAAAQRQRYAVALWAEHPQHAFAYPGGEDGRDPAPLAGLSEAWRRKEAGERGMITRAEGLLDSNDNAAALALARSVAPSDAGLRCRGLYVQGKALRNQRRYRSAVPVLEQVVKDCPDEAPKALYLLARVVAFRGQSADAVALFDRFVAAYPKHDFADDMLFFGGDQLTQRGRHREAERYYQRIIDDYPDGDYLEEARWRLAWGAHLAGDDAQARSRLDAIARATATAPDPRPYQQAVYWRARLALGKSRAAAIDELDALVRADPVSLYGVQARALLAREVPERARATDAWIAERARDFATAAAQAAPPPVPALPTAQLGHALVAAGLDEEAREVLDTIDYSTLALEAAVAIARDLATCGDTHNAHWIIRRRAEQELLGLPDPSDAALWRAGFPLGYAELVDDWAQKRTLDNKLVYALIREESAFDAPVVSWAGAIGLMQIMPSTGKEEAGLDKLEGFEVTQLRDPAVNVRLGTAHIARRLGHFGGNAPLAIASYNAGPANVRRWLKSSPGADLDVYLESIPVEQTRHYTKRVLRTWAVYRFLYHAEAPFLDLPEKVK